MLGSSRFNAQRGPQNEATTQFESPLPADSNDIIGIPRSRDAPFDVGLDMLPTILGLCGLEIPATVQGEDFSDYIVLSGEGGDPSGGAALLQCAHPFGEWTRKQGTCTARKKRIDLLRCHFQAKKRHHFTKTGSGRT